MKKVCWLLKVKPEFFDEYIEWHQAVDPEMLEELSKAGFRNYSIFLRRDDGLLVGYFEAEDPEDAMRKVGATEANRVWQAKMAPYFQPGHGAGDEQFLEQVFYMP